MASVLSGPKIVPCFGINGPAREAAEYYCRIFRNARIVNVAPFSEVGQEHHGKKPGEPMLIEMELEGQPFTILNGGPQEPFNMGVSFYVLCEDQREVDYYWKELTANGGQEGPCSWARDKYGVWWQVAPRRLIEMVKEVDSAGKPTAAGKRAMAAMMEMMKIDIAAVEKAYRGV